MKLTKIDADIQSSLNNIINKQPLINDIVRAIDAAGGKTYLVGGAVRDLFLIEKLKILISRSMVLM